MSPASVRVRSLSRVRRDLSVLHPTGSRRAATRVKVFVLAKMSLGLAGPCWDCSPVSGMNQVMFHSLIPKRDCSPKLGKPISLEYHN